MRKFKLLAIAVGIAGAAGAPGIAAAQVGPNPSVSGGSQDPTTRGGTDTVTAPQDARIGDGPSGNVLDRTIDTTTGADASVDTVDGSASTTVRTKTGTKPMQRPDTKR